MGFDPRPRSSCLRGRGSKPIVLEKSDYIGGIARMVNYKGNRIDIGGHRFFSKSDRVMDWWLKILPLQTSEKSPVTIQYHGMEQAVTPSASVPDTDSEDRVMLLRRRKSHIYYMRHFFEYPISFNWDALVKIGFWRACKMGLSYIRSALFPLKQQDTREQFLINRFGRELYRWFFKSYTEKIWGVPCTQISAEWGAQRIKGLSIWSTLRHALRKATQLNSRDIRQKGTETSVIEQFLYPKFGPGQMWEEVARRIREMGGEIHTGCRAERIVPDGWCVKAIEATRSETGQR